MLKIRHIRLLPVLVLVASLAFMVRVGDFYSTLGQMGAAQAQEPVQAEPPAFPDKMPPASAEQSSSLPMHPSGVEAKDMQPIEWHDASEADMEESESQKDIYKDLAQRRKDLEKREHVLERKEALLQAAERELDQKLRELTTIRDEIKGLMTKQSEEETARINSLVKIYEGMKAKDAARIFNTLDMDVLIEVMARMSERKSAPILAEMDSERARSVTILLAQRSKMPNILP